MGAKLDRLKELLDKNNETWSQAFDNVVCNNQAVVFTVAGDTQTRKERAELVVLLKELATVLVARTRL
jgi:hypothetical protein